MAILGGNHSSKAVRLKPALAGVALALTVLSETRSAGWQSGSRPGTTSRPASGLRDELATLLRERGPQAAIARVQAALQSAREDEAVRGEYIELHISLARVWMAERRFALAQAALEAVLAVDDDQREAARLLEAIEGARAAVGGRMGEVDRLLALELFEAALAAITEIEALRPELGGELERRRREAWLGAADDHYLARNFPEALTLYERVLTDDPTAGADVHSRWAVSLALALGEDESAAPGQREACGRLLARAIDVLRRTNEPVIGQIIGGHLAERSGQIPEAGRAYSDALGEAWTLPPAANRKRVVAELRRRCVDAARELYEATPPRRREGFWRSALEGAWKRRDTAHFVVEARSEWIAQRVADAAEHHFERLADWLSLDPARWSGRVEVRVHASLERLHQETGTAGQSRAVSRTRIDPGAEPQRSMALHQSDPWLLSATLPHELAHLVFAERLRQDGDGTLASAPCLAIDEGLAVQVEPAARRLQYRRLAPALGVDPGRLVEATTPGADPAIFYAQAAALVELLLRQRGMAGVVEAARGPKAETWEVLGFPDAAALRREWRAWYWAYRRPARMPLVILSEPASGRRAAERP